MEARVAYNDYIVRVPIGADASGLSSYTQSMGWTIIPLRQEKKSIKRATGKGLTSLRGILKLNGASSDEELRREALNDKYGLEL